MGNRGHRVVSRACARKRRYATEGTALARRRKLHAEAYSDVRKREVASLSAYACPYCGGWHLTSSPPPAL